MRRPPICCQILQHRPTHFRIVEHARRNIPAKLLAYAVLLLTQGLLQFLLGNPAAADAGDIIAGAAIADIGLDSPKSERQRDQRQEYLDYSAIVANIIEHAGLPYIE